MIGFQEREVAADLVGDEALEAMSVVIGEGELSAGVGPLAATDQPGGGRPFVELDVRRQLGDPGAVARLPVAVDCRYPRALGQIEDRGARRDVDGVAERELNVAVAARRREAWLAPAESARARITPSSAC
jgi:hypothetical protein